MNDRDEEIIESKLGDIKFGQVIHAGEFVAFLTIPNTSYNGLLHISNYSTEWTNPPLSQHLTQGDEVSVQLVAFNSTSQLWELSHSAAESYEEWVKSGPKKNEVVSGVVSQILPKGVLFRVADRWWAIWRTKENRFFEIAQASNLIAIGNSVQLRVHGWDVRGKGISVNLALENQKYSNNDEIVFSMTSFESRITKKKDRPQIHQIIYGVTDDGNWVHCYANYLREPENKFKLGQTVSAIVELRPVYFPFLHANLKEPEILEEPQITIGQETEALVISVMQYGAFCLISDYILGMIHHSKVIKETDFDSRKYLSPGDKVLVKIIDKKFDDNPSIPAHKKYQYELEFISMETSTEAKPESILVDLTIKKKQGSSGGYERDPGFRRSVLEAFNYTCCVCRERIHLGGLSPMEAAHILPRSQRGQNSLNNSACLCPIHHWAFDRGFITFDEELKICISSEITSLGEEGTILSKWAGQKALFPNEIAPVLQALTWHRRNIYRE